MTNFKFTRFLQFTYNKIKHCQVWFTPTETIEYVPPYIKGKKDCAWISFRPDNPPKTKKELEARIGMPIIDWE